MLCQEVNYPIYRELLGQAPSIFGRATDVRGNDQVIIVAKLQPQLIVVE